MNRLNRASSSTTLPTLSSMRWGHFHLFMILFKFDQSGKMKHNCDNHLFIYLGWDQRSPHLLSQQQAFHASASRNTQGLLDIASLFLFHFHFQTKTICESVNNWLINPKISSHFNLFNISWCRIWEAWTFPTLLLQRQLFSLLVFNFAIFQRRELPTSPCKRECVRSNINFHPQNQDVDFDMLQMFLAFNVLNMTWTDGWIQNF